MRVNEKHRRAKGSGACRNAGLGTTSLSLRSQWPRNESTDASDEKRDDRSHGPLS
jgi:hypothetical protein